MPFIYCVCSLLFAFSIIQIRIEETRVNKAKDFSKYVFAIMFPIVFNPKSIRNIHRVIFTILKEITCFIYPPLISRFNPRKMLIVIDIISKTYI